MRAITSRAKRSSPPCMKATKSPTIARCSSIDTRPEHGPPHLPIWPGKHGLPEVIARLYDESLHVRIGNTLSMRSIVSRTAHTLGYGPKYFAPRILRLRVTMTRGASSARVTARNGYDLSSRYLTLNGGSNCLIH